jgi:alcohol dehydrogenase
MKAAVIDRYGGNDAVSVADIAIPTLGATDLLVRVHAARVNPVDIKTRDGKLKTLLKYRFPLVLGNDLSGVVSDVGSRVTRFKKGDAVYARVDKDRIGTFAEFAVVRARNENGRAPQPEHRRRVCDGAANRHDPRSSEPSAGGAFCRTLTP